VILRGLDNASRAMNTSTEDLKITFVQHPLHADSEAAYNSRDLNRWVELYHEQSVLLDQTGKKLASGRDEIRSVLQGFLSLNGKVKIETTYAIEYGCVTLLRGLIELQYQDESGISQQMLTESIEVATRGADGIWRFKVDHPYGAQPKVAEVGV
jgi:ketosteroid isomerase-like protein